MLGNLLDGAGAGKVLGAEGRDSLGETIDGALVEIPSDESSGALGKDTAIGVEELMDDSGSELVGVGDAIESLGGNVEIGRAHV